MRLPWGKFRGQTLENVPAGYLGWIVEESNAEREIKLAALQELACRFGFESEEQPCQRCEELGRRWPAMYHRLALAVHPDRGGTTEAMQAVNELDEALRNVRER